MRALFFIFMALGACKQPTIDSGGNLLEAGGTATTWSMAATVDTNGGVYVDAQGGNSDAVEYQYTGLALQVASAPDGQVFANNLADKKWFALASGDSEVLFNVLVTTRGGYLCYTNGVRIDGTGYSVACKNGSLEGNTNVNGPIDERQRAALADACQRLSTSRIDGSLASDFYARYDRDRNRLACTCINGRSRDVEYATFANRQVSEFEDECRRRDATGNNPDTQNLSAQQRSELVRRECDALAGVTRGVSCQATLAVCGEVSRRQLSYDLYNGQTATFRADCLREIDAGQQQQLDPSGMGPISILQQLCSVQLGGLVTLDKTGCSCPNGTQLAFLPYAGRNDAFIDECR